MVFKTTDGTQDYFMLVHMDVVLMGASNIVSSYQHKLQYADFEEVLGVAWALETDFSTAKYIREKMPIRAYFRMSGGSFGMLSITYDLSQENGSCFCPGEVRLHQLSRAIYPFNDKLK